MVAISACNKDDAFCDRENYAQKYQMVKFTAVGNFLDWSKDSGKEDH